jgi:uncharacterized membrane protein YjfL (UPF0719 family)
MDWGYPLLMLAQLVVAVLTGAVATYMGVVLFDRATRGIDEWQELRQGNPAIGIVLGAIVVAVAWILRPALQVPVGGWDVGGLRVAAALAVEAVQLLLGLILAVLSILFALWLFDRFTARLDEWAELQRGNVAVAALLAGVILAVALLVGTATEEIFQLVTPYLF